MEEGQPPGCKLSDGGGCAWPIVLVGVVVVGVVTAVVECPGGEVYELEDCRGGKTGGTGEDPNPI